MRVHKKPLSEGRDSTGDVQPTDEAPQPRRINITHNGSSNNKLTSESTEDAENRFSDEFEGNGQTRGEKVVENASINPVESSTYGSLKEEKIQVARKQPQINTADENEASAAADDDEIDDEEDIIEDDEDDLDNESITATPKAIAKEVTEPGTSKLADGTVILTSNFFLPGKSDEDNNEANEETNENGDSVDEDAIEEPAETPKSTTKNVPTTTTPATTASTTTTTTTAATTTAKTTTSTEAPLVEYEYEYEDYVDETTTIASQPARPTQSTTTNAKSTSDIPPTTSTLKAIAATKNKTEDDDDDDNNDSHQREVVSVVTTKSVANGSSSASPPAVNKPTPSPDGTDEIEDGSANTTESWVVVASVQTSRSISGARFLPFPQVEQEEKKQSLADLDKEGEEGDETANDDDDDEDDDVAKKEDAQLVTTARPVDTTMSSVENTTHVSTIRINKEPNSSDLKKIHEKLLLDNVELTTKGVPVFIRKFSPKTTKTPVLTGSSAASSRPADAKNTLTPENVQQDDLSGLLPAGFKFRPTGSYKNRKITTTTDKPSDADETHQEVRIRNETDSRSYKNKVAAQDINGSPDKDYKSGLAVDKSKDGDNESGSNFKVTDPFAKIQIDNDLDKLLPKEYTVQKETTKAPLSVSTVTDNINKFLPPGFKLRKEEAKPTTSTHRPRLPSFTVADDSNKFLPSGLKPQADEKPLVPKVVVVNDELSKFLPPEYKPSATEEEAPAAEEILNKIKFKADISGLLPPGFKIPDEPTSTTTAKPSDDAGSSSFKVVFPKGIKKPPRLTTVRPQGAEGPSRPLITIRKGLPTR